MMKLGGRNKLATALGVDGSYLGRVVGEKKPMTKDMIERLKSLRQTSDTPGAN